MMPRMRFPTLVLPLLGVAVACAGVPPSGALQNENRHLHGIVRSQERRIEDLTEQRNDLERRVAELESDVARGADAEETVEQAKSEISSQVSLMVEKFKSDSDVLVEQSAGGYRFVLREKVLFGTASADLSDDGKAALRRVADALRGGTTRIRIEGHTDNQPLAKEATRERFPRGNMELSAARALAVWEFLVADGNLGAARLSVVGFGEHQPRVPNDSERNRYRNRRVEILVEERR